MNPDNESKQERLRIRRDRDTQARAQETTEEKEVRLAKRREKHRALKIQGTTIALDANRASQQLRRDTETPEARQILLRPDRHAYSKWLLQLKPAEPRGKEATESHSEGRGGSGEKRRGCSHIRFNVCCLHSQTTSITRCIALSLFPLSIYEKEPTSIIAFALSSREYLRKLKLLQERTAVKLSRASVKVTEVKPAPTSSPKPYFKFPQPFYKKRHTSDSEKGLPPGANAANIKTNLKAVINELKKKGSGISLFSGSASIQTAPEALETSSKKAELTTSFSVKSYNPSIASSWLSDPSTEGVGPNVGLGGADEIDSGKTTSHVSLEFTSPDKLASFFCKVYYAEKFRELRELIFPSGEESFICSLSHCIKYDAKGGKSRSAFCKVADDRFILKQVKSIEISSFELFAPHYLKHVTKALEDKRPSPWPRSSVHTVLGSATLVPVPQSDWMF
ncbi:1-phosphatidylinositol 3-phosphate 5-kinase-like [Halichondria panicea]|uniref:1-phosphatidylinositol 3-phosphate 5-kinase-like n=1 Tax=Halichondria panicea TaxID=6063 RepID=UPI00312B67A3